MSVAQIEAEAHEFAAPAHTQEVSAAQIESAVPPPTVTQPVAIADIVREQEAARVAEVAEAAAPEAAAPEAAAPEAAGVHADAPPAGPPHDNGEQKAPDPPAATEAAGAEPSAPPPAAPDTPPGEPVRRE